MTNQLRPALEWAPHGIIHAPGRPGNAPTWAPGAKSGVGCAVSASSKVWFTFGRGIVYEVFHPWVDHTAVRELGFIITGPDGLFCDEAADCLTDTRCVEPGVPAYRITNQSRDGRFEITKQIITDPDRDVLVQRIRFIPRVGVIGDYRLYVIASPRLGDQGEDNTGWVGSHRGRDMLFASHGGHALAIACSAAWLVRSVGYVGKSDARTNLQQTGAMTWRYDRAEHGHVALAGEIDLAGSDGRFVLALALDRSADAAALNASLSLDGGFDQPHDLYVTQWRDRQKSWLQLDDCDCDSLTSAGADQRQRPDSSRPRVLQTDLDGPVHVDMYRTSTMVLTVHRSKQCAGAGVASLAVPWGDVRGKGDRGGYHLVWARDLVEESLGFLAAGGFYESRCVLNYLRATQNPDGGWPQDMWIDGSAYGGGVQLDEAALPILLVDISHRESAINDEQLESFWPMMKKAAGFVIRTGPSTGEGRWENAPGLQPYTLAATVAGLVVTAKYADRFKEPGLADYFRQTADLWNGSIEDWTYVTRTPLAERVGVDGYYVRLAPSPGMRSFRERGERPTQKQARDLHDDEVVSADSLALVRFGLRAADDPRILNTVKVLDAVTKADLPAGPCWRRYNGGYYGETDSGDPFTGVSDKQGHGRAWPLLTGERGHYEIAAGNLDRARQMLATMGGLASQTGLLPEQVWDAADLPEKYLFAGRPTGSAMPLAWTHSEYIRLLLSIRDRRVFDLPADAHNRYVKRASAGG